MVHCGIKIVLFGYSLCLGVHTDSIGTDLLIVVAKYVSQSITDTRITLVGTHKGIVMISSAVLAIVLKVHCTGVQQTSLMMIVDITVTNGKITGTYGEIHQSVPIFFHRFILAVHITVIHPDMMRATCCDAIRICMMDCQVTDDDILLTFDIQSDTGQFCSFHTYDRLVATYRYKVFLAIQSITGHLALHYNNIRR